MTVKLFLIKDRSGKEFSVNPEHIVAVDWENRRLVFSNDENLYLRNNSEIFNALKEMGVEHGHSN